MEISLSLSRQKVKLGGFRLFVMLGVGTLCQAAAANVASETRFTIEPVSVAAPFASFYRENPLYEVRQLPSGAEILSIQSVAEVWKIVTRDGVYVAVDGVLDELVFLPVPAGMSVIDVISAGDYLLMRFFPSGTFRQRLAVSADGVNWDILPEENYPTGTQWFSWKDAFYQFSSGRLRRSANGSNWETILPAPYWEAWTQGWTGHVVMVPAGEYLFAFGLSSVLISEDGVSWAEVYEGQQFRFALNQPGEVFGWDDTLQIRRPKQVSGSQSGVTVQLTKRGAAAWELEEIATTAVAPLGVWEEGGFISTEMPTDNGAMLRGIFHSHDLENWSRVFVAGGVESRIRTFAVSANAVLADINGFLLYCRFLNEHRRVVETKLPFAFEAQILPPIRVADRADLQARVAALQRAAATGDLDALDELADMLAVGTNAVMKNVPQAVYFAKQIAAIDRNGIDLIAYAELLAQISPLENEEMVSVLEEARAQRESGVWSLYAKQLFTDTLGTPDSAKAMELLREGVEVGDDDATLLYAQVLGYGLHGQAVDREAARALLPALERSVLRASDVAALRRHLEAEPTP